MKQKNQSKRKKFRNTLKTSDVTIDSSTTTRERIPHRQGDMRRPSRGLCQQLPLRGGSEQGRVWQ